MSSVFTEQAAASYAEGTPRKVPGYAGLLRMTALLLAEQVPLHGRVLVLGAGGGLELRALADAHAGWTFDGVDPSPAMLALARETASAHLDRISLNEGYIDIAPDGPFDAATCLLTLHFVPRDQRLDTLSQIRRRLRPGAPFVAAHISVPRTEPERSLWIGRHIAYGSPDGTPPAQLEPSRQAMIEKLSFVSPEEDEVLLRQAGFSDVSLFYLGFAVRGWVAYADEFAP